MQLTWIDLLVISILGVFCTFAFWCIERISKRTDNHHQSENFASANSTEPAVVKLFDEDEAARRKLIVLKRVAYLYPSLFNEDDARDLQELSTTDSKERALAILNGLWPKVQHVSKLQ